MAEDDKVGWYHCLSGQEFEQTLGDGEGQGVLQFMVSQRVGHDLLTAQQLFPDIHGHLPSAQFGKQSTLPIELPSPNLLQTQKTYEVLEIQMRKQTQPS